jgi:hypothetical protein
MDGGRDDSSLYPMRLLPSELLGIADSGRRHPVEESSMTTSLKNWRRGSKLALTLPCLLLSVTSFAAQYVVDIGNPSAADSNNGSAAAPWKTLYALTGKRLAPGDVVTVKNGVYSMPTGGDWSTPVANLGASGTSDNPIVIKSEQPRGAVLDGGGNAANAPLGASGVSYITIDGFEIRNIGPKGIAIFDAVGVIVQNCYIHKVRWNTVTGDNTEAIRVERSRNILIRNNEVTDVDNGVSGSMNAAGIKLYDSSSVIAENNYFHDYSGIAIYDKRGGQSSTYRFNLLENVYDAFGANTVSGYASGELRYYSNVVKNVQNLFQTADAFTGNLYVYNNSFIGYRGMGLRARSSLEGYKFYSYNNIFVRSASASPVGELVVDSMSRVGLSDFNVYPSPSSLFVTGQYTGSEVHYNSLDAWRSANPQFDRNSRTAVPDFIDLVTGNLKLSLLSALKGVGRVGGLATGAVVDPGAYATGTEVIGLTSQLQSLIKPVAPVLQVR